MGLMAFRHVGEGHFTSLEKLKMLFLEKQVVRSPTGPLGTTGTLENTV